jgi:hypothetical protein
VVSVLLAIAASADKLTHEYEIAAAVLLDYEITASGNVVGTLLNNTRNRVTDVEVFVVYSWIRPRGSVGEDNYSRSMTYTLPIDLSPGESMPVDIASARPAPDDDHYSITAKVVGYTRYRWANTRFDD